MYIRFYTDHYASNKEAYAECPHVGMRPFFKQMYAHCTHMFNKTPEEVDVAIDEFRSYKGTVPTYGAILLDPSMNYCLLVQVGTVVVDKLFGLL